MKLQDAVKVARSVKIEHARKFATHVVPEVVRPARVIWNQAIGAMFLLFAMLFLGNSVRYYQTLSTPAPNPVAFGFSIFLGAIMGFFGITSFLKARRIGRRV